MTNNYSEIQQKIIDSTSNRVLVSASAGTGKTFIMVEKIIDLIKNHNYDISNLLVVTFTDAAAEEMRLRITNALTCELSSNPSLLPQVKKIPTSAISTIHSFCSNLIRKYIYAVNVPPKFKIIDDLNAKALRNNVLKDILDNLYENLDDDFLNLSDIFAENRTDDSLEKIILSLYDYSRSLDDPIGFLYNSQTLKNPLVYEDIICNTLNRKSNYYLNIFNKLLVELNQAELTKDIEVCQQIINSINESLKAKSLIEKTQCLAIDFDSVGRTKDLLGVHDKFKDEKDDYVDSLKTVKNISTILKRKDTFNSINKNIKEICKLTILFGEQYAIEKKNIGVLDFSDLEHFTLVLLKNDDILKEIQDEYRYIFVDEYQDVSKIQESIISKISEHSKLFTVGDLKQSIYRFRQSDMQIFKNRQMEYEKEIKDVFFLKDNYRSGGNILYFVNEIFKVIMGPENGIDYLNTSMFESPNETFGDVHLDIINLESVKDDTESKIYSVEEDKIQDSEINAGIAEGIFVSQKIKSLVGTTFFDGKENRPIEYQDISILSRSINSAKVLAFCKTIQQNGIPLVTSSDNASLIECAEVEMAINFLKVLQNYKDDIPLISVLKSPFFSFTDSELYDISHNAKTKNFNNKFFHQCFYAEKDNIAYKAKIENFFKTIDLYKTFTLARGGAYALKRAITETNFEFITLSRPNGKEKMSHVNELVSKLEQLDETKNLPTLLKKIDLLKDEINASNSANPSGSVKLMTIHKSKGLEFPICFIINTATDYKDETGKVITDTNLGIAMKEYDETNKKVFDSIPYYALSYLNKDAIREEELRLLYVALTRAKSKLYIVGVNNITKNNIRKNSLTQYRDDQIKPLEIYETNNYLDLIIGALIDNKCVIDVNFHDDIKPSEAICGDNQIPRDKSFPKTEKAILDNLNYVYPSIKETTLPTKFAASNLKKDFFFESDVSYELKSIINENKTQLGTDYHKILEICDINSSYEDVVEQYNYCLSSNLISDSSEGKINLEAIHKVLNLPIMNFGKAYKEKPFEILAPANRFTEYDSNEEVLIQGVIDLLLVNGKEACVIDYKYTQNTDVNKIKEKYRSQLETYKYAVESTLDLRVTKLVIINLTNQEIIEF